MLLCQTINLTVDQKLLRKSQLSRLKRATNQLSLVDQIRALFLQPELHRQPLRQTNDFPLERVERVFRHLIHGSSVATADDLAILIQNSTLRAERIVVRIVPVQERTCRIESVKLSCVLLDCLLAGAVLAPPQWVPAFFDSVNSDPVIVLLRQIVLQVVAESLKDLLPNCPLSQGRDEQRFRNRQRVC